jgi:hypothetical protein
MNTLKRWIPLMALVLLGAWAGNSVLSLIAIGCALGIFIFFSEIVKFQAGFYPKREPMPLPPQMQGGG